MESEVVEASWEQFYQMMNVQFPHARVYALRVTEGALVTCERVQATILLTREEAREGRCAPPIWNAQWRQLRTICAELRSGILPEVTFRDGSPQTILSESSGWAFADMAAAETPHDLRRMTVAA